MLSVYMGARKRKLSGLLLVGGVLLSLVLCTFPILYNRLTLLVFSQRLFGYPLPPDTEVISRQMQVGVLTGNGNHCDFLASMLLRTTLGKQEIEAYYEDVTFPSVGENSTMAAMSGLDGVLPVLLEFDPANSEYVTVKLLDGIYTDWPRMLDGSCH